MENTTILIEEREKEDARALTQSFTRSDVKSRAYINALGAKVCEKYLISENISAEKTYNLHDIRKIIEEFDVSDIMLSNIHVDVRVVFDENQIFIPKSHFEYNILPDIYVVFKLSKDHSFVEFLGFFEPKLINKNNANDKYYFMEKEKLSSPVDLKDYIQNSEKATAKEYSDEEKNSAKLLMVSMADNNVSDNEKRQLFEYLINSKELRDEFIEFENFEMLSYQATNIVGLELQTNTTEIEIADIPTEDMPTEIADEIIANSEDYFTADENAAEIDVFGDLEAPIEIEGAGLASAALAGAESTLDTTENIVNAAANVANITSDAIDMAESIQNMAEQVFAEPEFLTDSSNIEDVDILDNSSFEVQDFEVQDFQAQDDEVIFEDNSYEDEVLFTNNNDDSIRTPISEATDLTSIEDIALQNIPSIPERVENIETDIIDNYEDSSTVEFNNLEVTDLNAQNTTGLDIEYTSHEGEISSTDFVLDLSTINETNPIGTIDTTNENMTDNFDEYSVESLGEDIPDSFGEENISVVDDNISGNFEEYSVESIGGDVPDSFGEENISVVDDNISGNFEEYSVESIGEDVPNSFGEENIETISELNLNNAEQDISDMSFIEENYTQEFPEIVEEQTPIEQTNENQEVISETSDAIEVQDDLDEDLSLLKELEQTSENIVTENEKLGVLYSGSEDNSSVEIDTSDILPKDIVYNYKPEKKASKLLPVFAIIAAIIIAGSVVGFLMKNKGNLDSETLIQTTPENETIETPEANNSDILVSSNDMDNSDIIPPEAKELDKTSEIKTVTPASPINSSKIITLKKMSWEVPDYLSYSENIKKYLQTAGKSIKLTLSSDLLLTNEYIYSNQVKVNLKLDKNGTIQNASVVKSSGSQQVDNVILKTVKDTLNVVKPVPGEVPTPTYNLAIVIYL